MPAFLPILLDVSTLISIAHSSCVVLCTASVFRELFTTTAVFATLAFLTHCCDIPMIFQFLSVLGPWNNNYGAFLLLGQTLTISNISVVEVIDISTPQRITKFCYINFSTSTDDHASDFFWRRGEGWWMVVYSSYYKILTKRFQIIILDKKNDRTLHHAPIGLSAPLVESRCIEIFCPYMWFSLQWQFASY